MSKKLIVCADGTRNKVEKAKSGKQTSTNVAKFAAALRSTDALGTAQLLCYLKGIGTHRGEWISGGMFGLGISPNIGRAYEFLVRYYEPGDEIGIFGFSRTNGVSQKRPTISSTARPYFFSNNDRYAS